MRSKKNGIVVGDKMQIDFDKFVSHSIFQSKFSKKLFNQKDLKEIFQSLRMVQMMKNLIYIKKNFL